MRNQVTLASRYQYAPNDPLSSSPSGKMYRCYDKSTKRDLLLQLLPKEDKVISLLRDIKHPFLQLIVDVIPAGEQGQTAVIMQGGVICSLQTVMQRNGYLMQQDALVIFKYLALALKELHTKLIVYARLCMANIQMCTLSLIKLGHNVTSQHMPISFKSPQAIRGQQVSYASDIYSLGVILYRMIYGVLPFSSQNGDPSQMVKRVKGKKFNEEWKETSSPFGIIVSKEVQFLVQAMLDYYPENRPSLQQVLSSTLLAFPIQTEFQPYLKPKVNLMPQPFIKRYLLYRPTKTLHKYDNYYQEHSYMALSTKDKMMVRVYCPQIRMFQAQPRKVQGYFQKLRAIQQGYSQENTQFLLKIEDAQRFRQQPVIVTQYANQGDLYSYLQKRKPYFGWLNEKQSNMVIYLMAIALKQMRQLGLTSIHTIHCQRILIKDRSIKVRQPGMLAPSIQKKLTQSKQVDYFAPELKDNRELVQLDRSDMWSLGVLYYYLLAGQMPVLNQEGQIQLGSLSTSQKNRNIIGRCLSTTVSTRQELTEWKMDNVDEDLLGLMLREKHQAQQAKKLDTQEEQLEENIQKDRKVMFQRRKKRVFKDYNKIIVESSTSTCRIVCKAVFIALVLLIVFFGMFIIQAGQGLLRTTYYKPITMEVPYNYGTSLINMTILTSDGSNIQTHYSQYSYEQFTQTLRCYTDNYKSSGGSISSFINSSYSVFCFFGFVWMLGATILIIIIQSKFDLPSLLNERNTTKQNKNLIHYGMLLITIPSNLFSFFYAYAITYLIQDYPCIGVKNLAFPAFTSIDSLLQNDGKTYFSKVVLTVILWAVLLMLYGYVTIFAKKVNARVLQWKIIIPFIVVMVVYTVICRVGFGSPAILQPSWSDKINTDLALYQYYGLFGFFPQLLCLGIFLFERLIDFGFWFFLKMGLDGDTQQNIKQVKIVQAKYESLESLKLQNQKSNIYMIEHEFERFD